MQEPDIICFGGLLCRWRGGGHQAPRLSREQVCQDGAEDGFGQAEAGWPCLIVPAAEAGT